MFDFLFNPNGRVSRKGIWLGLFLPQVGLGFLAGLIDGVSVGAALAEGQAPTGGLATALVSLFFLWPGIAVPVKRFHDRGMSGWWVLWFLLIVGAGLAFAFMDAANAASTGRGGVGMTIGFLVALGALLVQFVILYLLPGHQGANAYGPDPRDGSGRAVSADAGSGAAWAARLEPSRMAAAAKTAKAAPPGSAQGAREINWPSSAGRRASFGRRGA